MWSPLVAVPVVTARIPLWLLAAAYLMRLVTALLWWTAPVVIDRISTRMHERQGDRRPVRGYSSRARGVVERQEAG